MNKLKERRIKKKLKKASFFSLVTKAENWNQDNDDNYDNYKYGVLILLEIARRLQQYFPRFSTSKLSSPKLHNPSINSDK